MPLHVNAPSSWPPSNNIHGGRHTLEWHVSDLLSRPASFPLGRHPLDGTTRRFLVGERRFTLLMEDDPLVNRGG